jgi:hypothetical protein
MRIQFLYPCIKWEQERIGTLNTSALDRMTSQTQARGIYVAYGTDLVHSVTP